MAARVSVVQRTGRGTHQPWRYGRRCDGCERGWSKKETIRPGKPSRASLQTHAQPRDFAAAPPRCRRERRPRPRPHRAAQRPHRCDVTSCDVLSRRGVHRSRSAIVLAMKGLKKSFVRAPSRRRVRRPDFLRTAQEELPGLHLRKVKGLKIPAPRLCPPAPAPKHRQASPPARPSRPRSARRIRQQQHQPFPPCPTTGPVHPRHGPSTPATRP
jgi:hypothetical protein